MAVVDTKTAVLHVIDTTGPGGAETVFLDLAEECSHRGWKSIALIRGRGWVEDQLVDRRIKYFIRDCKGSLNTKFLYQMAQIVRRERVTLIQSHLLGSNVYASLLGIFLRIPVVATFHGHVDISAEERLRNTKLGIIRAGTKQVVCVTRDLTESINRSASRWAQLKPVVIPNGIRMDGLAALPISPIRVPLGRLVFGCLGNIRPAKNYKLAVDFIAFLKARGVNAVLLIAGDDTKPEACQLKTYAESQGVESDVNFLGFVKNVTGFFRDIDIFLMTSSSEGHPLALTQAIAAGKPVLSTPNGVEKVIPEELMFLSKEHSVEALHAALDRLLKSHRLTEVLAQGREYVQDHYSSDAMFRAYFGIYDV